jgi:hypothetical protein
MPPSSDLFVDFCKELDDLILVHLLVDITVVLVVLGRLEALRMLASNDSALLRFILTEVEAFSWEHILSN